MKTFEEKYTAWIDGTLSGTELAEFEKELEAGAADDKAGALKLGELLRSHGAAPPLTNTEFFNSRLMEQIAAETKPANAPAQGRGWFQWTLPRMAWAGACCLAMTFALYATMVRESLQPPPTETEYVAKVLEMRTDDPSITATALHSKENDVTVIWLGGLNYLPDTYGL